MGFDPTVKVSKLTPEELEKYRKGQHGGKPMFTHDDFKQLQAEGLSVKQIAKQLGVSTATLYNKVGAWKKAEREQAQKPNHKQAEAVKVEVELKATETVVTVGESELQEEIKELKYLLKRKDRELEEQKEKADDLLETYQKTAHTSNQQAEQIKELEQELFLSEQKTQEANSLAGSLKAENEALRIRANSFEMEYLKLEQELKPLRQLVFTQLRRDLEV